MGVINKIREKTGLAVGIIAVGLGLFVVGGDLLGPNSTLLGNSRNEVGEIAGNTITLEEFQAKVEELAFNYSLSTGRNPNADEMVTVRQQAWDMLVNKYAYESEFSQLGITVSDDEVVDMVQGTNISPEIRQAFTNPETGEFDRDQVTSYLQNLSNMPPQQQAAWYNFENTLGPARLLLKFDNLFIKTNFVTTEEARNEYVQANKVAEVKYLYIPYYTINDSSIAVTDSELQSYLDKNKEQYRRDLSRSLKYVSFPVVASPEDTAAVVEEIEEIKVQLAQSKNDSVFARANTDGLTPFRTYTPDQLPAILTDTIKSLNEGDIIGPLLANSQYVIYKISSISEGATANARASHILFKADDDTEAAKNAAKQEARRILNEIKKGASFAEMARIHGTDGTASRGGDLGWFPEGRMVEPFENAVFSAKRTGLLNDVVETDFGFHIIDVTAVKNSTVYKIATIEKEIIASDETRNEAFREADLFALSSENIEQFEAGARERGYTVEQGLNITPSARRVNTLTDARSIVIWLFNEAETGEVSEVFDLEDEYVVAVMTGEQPEGLAQLETVRQDLTTKVKNEKKAEKIIAQLAGKSGTLDEIAEQFGEDASVYNMSDLKLSSNALTGVGFAPVVVGKAFAMQAGGRTEPLRADNGVVVLELVSLTEAPEQTDLTTYQNQISQRRQSRIAFSLAEAVKDFADIEDNRYKFF